MPVDPTMARRLRTAVKRINDAVRERDRLVVEARQSASLRDVAAVIGLTHTAVAKIEERWRRGGG